MVHYDDGDKRLEQFNELKVQLLQSNDSNSRRGAAAASAGSGQGNAAVALTAAGESKGKEKAAEEKVRFVAHSRRAVKTHMILSDSDGGQDGDETQKNLQQQHSDSDPGDETSRSVTKQSDKSA